MYNNVSKQNNYVSDMIHGQHRRKVADFFILQCRL